MRVEVTEINIWSVIRKSVKSFSSQPASEHFKNDIVSHIIAELGLSKLSQCWLV